MPATRFEVIVVDNSPAALSARQTCAAFTSGMAITYVEEPRTGLSFARNRGLEAATAEIVAFIDDDAEADPGWVEALTAAFCRVQARPIAVGGPVHPLWHSRRPKWLPPAFLSTLSLVDYGPEARALAFPEEFLAGCNFAFGTSFLREAGGFDPALGRRAGTLLSNEDIAVLSRVVAAGGRVLYEPGAAVLHHIPRDRVRFGWFLRRMYFQGRSDVLMEARPSYPAAPRSMQHRLLGHLRRAPSQGLGNPVHAAFTLAMAVAYAAGRLAPGARTPS
jgi:glycosyltransferase involved in cell wall biosynthesis